MACMANVGNRGAWYAMRVLFLSTSSLWSAVVMHIPTATHLHTITTEQLASRRSIAIKICLLILQRVKPDELINHEFKTRQDTDYRKNHELHIMMVRIWHGTDIIVVALLCVVFRLHRLWFLPNMRKRI